MKKNVHPKYHLVKVIMTNGETFEVGSTYAGSELILDIDPSCHPAWTGGQRMAPKGRGVEFENRFKGLSNFTLTKS